MVPLGLHCCVQAFSSCSEKGTIPCCGSQPSHCCGFYHGAQAPGTQASVVPAFRLSSCSSQTAEFRLSSCGTKALVTLWHVGSSQARDQMCVPFMDRWISIHCTTREVPFYLIFLIFSKASTVGDFIAYYIFPLQCLMRVFIRKLSFIFDKNHSVKFLLI